MPQLSQQGFIGAIKDILQPILSPRQSMEVINESLSCLNSEQQSFALHWAKVVSVSNIELAYVFLAILNRAYKALDGKGVSLWLANGLSIYDQEGLYPAIQALEAVDKFKQHYIQQKYACSLEEVKPSLDLFIRGLIGRDLSIKPGDESYTDTDHLYLPESISVYQDKQKNKALYKASACFLWAQNWYGTFKRQSLNSVNTQDKLESYKNPALAKRYFLILENIRLMANIERDLPGLYREMEALSPLILPEDKTWQVILNRLKKPNTSVQTTFDALEVILKLGVFLPETSYQGGLNISEVILCSEQREQETIKHINNLLYKNTIDEVQLSQAIEAANDSAVDSQACQSDDKISEGETGKQKPTAGEYDNTDLKDLLNTLLEDIESVNQDDFKVDDQTKLSHNKTAKKPNNTMGGFQADAYLDEWDYLRQNYRKAWCCLRIKQIEPTEDGFKQATLAKYPYLIAQVRKLFEAMRDQAQTENKQTDGEELDLNALVEMHTAQRAGEELSERVYIRRLHNNRSVAVCLLVDMSGSTKGWINLAMKESLIIFAQALSILGDQYAILGFSGLTRQRCEIYKVKEFNDNNQKLIESRISNIQAKDYTRMGFAVRYASQQLLKVECKHRILLILSDGKPDDYDGYQGQYGIEDTRKAILEAQGQTISPFSITIDKQAQSYLPSLFGPGQYTILDDVSKLPLKLSEIYRKLSH